MPSPAEVAASHRRHANITRAYERVKQARFDGTYQQIVDAETDLDELLDRLPRENA